MKITPTAPLKGCNTLVPVNLVSKPKQLVYSWISHSQFIYFRINKKMKKFKCKCIAHFFTFIDAPVYLSFPHFYKADPKLLDDVEGLSPDQEKHETFLKIQPVSFKSLNYY